MDTQTDEVDLYVELFGQLVNASRAQATLRPMMERHLTRRDERGAARRLFPSTRVGEELGPRSIVIDPERRFGRPLIEGTSIETAIVAQRFKAGESWSELAEDFLVDESAIAETVRFETELRRAA